MSQITPKPGRRPSRLSEGSSSRSLDYSIQYVGKTAASQIISGHKTPSFLQFSVAGNRASRIDNRIHGGENLGILRSFLDDPSISSNVTLIYIDPPFATGATFESRDAERAYDDAATGARYIEFLRQRLIVLRELMASNGSIYLHLDSKMAFPAKIIMDEIFGPSNFRNWITRKKSNRKNFTRKQYGNISDFILFYSKTGDYVWNRPYERWTQEWVNQEYQYVDTDGRRFKKVPVHAPGVRNGETGKLWKGRLPPPGKHWQYTPATLDDMDARGEIYWSPTGNPRRKIYHDQSDGVAVQDIWLEFRDAHNQNIDVTGYPTEKNVDMLRRIVAASSNPGDLVLDCFMGSGTTPIAAEELERRWIGIDSGATALETTLKRLANGSEPMGDFVTGKKVKKSKGPSLFSSGILTSGFDLYLTDDVIPHPPTKATLARWASLFPTSRASTSG